MKTHHISALPISLLAFGGLLLAALPGWCQTGDEDPKATRDAQIRAKLQNAAEARTRAEGLRDRTPGAQFLSPGADWQLIATEDGGKLVGRVSWENQPLTSIFGIEASSSLQKGAEEVDLLNLDGLAGGDAAISAHWTRSGRILRRSRPGCAPSDLLDQLCRDVRQAQERELIVDRCPRCDENQQMAPIIPTAQCTADYFEALSGSWAEQGLKASAEILQTGCDELTKLNSRWQFLPVGTPSNGPSLDPCTQENLKAAVVEERSERQEQADDLSSQILQKKAEIRDLDIAAARLSAEFAGVRSAGERERIALARLRISNRAGEERQLIAQLEAKKKPLLPPLVDNFDQWWDKTTKAKFGALCQKYNRPDRSQHLTLASEEEAVPWDQDCNLKAIREALSALSDDLERSELQSRIESSQPVGAWFLTFSAGASNKDFKYIAEAPTTATFAEIEGAVTKDSKAETHYGVSWSLQSGNNFWSVGYKRRDKFGGGTAAELCAPLDAGGTVTRCVDTTLGAPKKTAQNLGMLEWRRFLSPSVGLKLRAFYVDEDFRQGQILENEWEGHALLYFLRDKDRGLTGGIDVAYDTAFDDFNARVFIGQAFSLRRN